MKKLKFTESRIIKILQEFYNWKKKYAGMDASQLKRLKELEEENHRLKRMYADLSLDHEMLKDVLGKKF